MIGRSLAGFGMALTVLLGNGTTASAADQSAPGVARLSALDGSVQLKRGDTDQAYAAALNGPLATGDYLTTGDGARAEVEFDHASLLRVAPQTQVRFVKLDDGQHELQLAQGTVEIRLFHGVDAHPLVDTPVATVIPDDNGRYRVTVTSDGNTEVTVRSGHADVQIGNDNQTRTLDPGATLLITGQGANPQIRSIDTVADDGFDGWADARDGRWSDVSNWAYTDNGMVGAADLNQYGQWSDNAQYGQVWQPSDEPENWSPYSDGSFVWEPYYGWTWVGDEPWGYAPYHYGRWFYANAWYWAPGPIAPYAYAPAVVGFFGWGGGGFGGGFAGIGWCPLAPGERFSPWWGGGGSLTFNGYFGGNGWNGNGWNSDRWNGSGWHGGPPSDEPGGLPPGAQPGHGSPRFVNAGAPGGSLGVGGAAFGSEHFDHIAPIGTGQHAQPIEGALPLAPTSRNLAPGGHVIANGVHPLSPRFAAFAPVRSVETFAQERRQADAAVADRAALPRGNAYGATQPASVWSRFGAPERGEQTPDRIQTPSYAQRDPNADQQPATHAFAAPSRASEPSFATPRYAQPHDGAPSYARPTYGTPQYGRPSYGTPQYARPSYGTPHSSRPSYGASQYGRSSYGAPRGVQSHTSAPASSTHAAPSGGERRR